MRIRRAVLPLLAVLLACALGAAAAAGAITGAAITDGILTWDPWPGATGDYFVFIDGVSRILGGPPADLRAIIDEMVARGEIHNVPEHSVSVETYGEDGSLLASWEGTFRYLCPDFPEYAVPTVKLNPTIGSDGIMRWEAHSTDTARYSYGVEGVSQLTTELSVDLFAYIDAMVTDWTLPYATSFRVELCALNAAGETLDKWTGTVEHTPVIGLLHIGDTMCTGIAERGYLYKGKPVRPSFSLYYHNTELKKGEDYTCVYRNNKGPGVASVKVRGKGRLTGSFTLTFSIRDKAAVTGGLKYSLSATAATVTGPKSKGTKKLTVPDSLELWGLDFPVTAVKANAFRGMKKLTSVTVGANVAKIGKAAFYKCAKLKNIVLKTAKLTSKSVGAKAFKGVYKKAKVTVPAKKLKAYKKLLVKKGLPKTAIIRK